MAERGGGAGPGGAGRRKVFANESWLVEYSPRDGCLVFVATDYHAEPLKVDAGRWREFGEALGKAVGRSPAVEAPPPAAAVHDPSPGSGRHASGQAAQAPPDLRVVLRDEAWAVAVSRREKRAYFECAASPGKPLAVTRRDLYRIGKKMGKRGARRVAAARA